MAETALLYLYPTCAGLYGLPRKRMPKRAAPCQYLRRIRGARTAMYWTLEVQQLRE